MTHQNENESPYPLRVMFLLTSMPVGGAETLLVNLVRRMDRARFAPEIACLKERGPLGDMLAEEMPVHCKLTTGKFDLRVLPRLVRLLRERQVDAVVTVGAGDKMFWGRLAANLAGVKVVCSALHSTGWPDGVGRLNRMLTPITDAFIAVATPHGEHLVQRERFPREKVVVIPNGVDTTRFAPPVDPHSLRARMGIGPTAPVMGIVAALRPEKNHELFLDAAQRVREQLPDARFLIVGDGPRRPELEQYATERGLSQCVQFLGTRSDIPDLIGTMDVLALTSHNEANPVSILEAMSCGVPVVTTNVGSIAEVISHGHNGLLVPPGDAERFAEHTLDLLCDPLARGELGGQARETVVEGWSLDRMVSGYEQLIEGVYSRKTGRMPANSARRGEKRELPPLVATH